MSNQPDELRRRILTVVNVLNYAAYTYVEACRLYPGDSALTSFERATQARNRAADCLFDLVQSIVASGNDDTEPETDDDGIDLEDAAVTYTVSTKPDPNHYPNSPDDARWRLARLRDYYYTRSRAEGAEPLLDAIYTQLDNALYMLETGDEDE